MRRHRPILTPIADNTPTINLRTIEGITSSIPFFAFAILLNHTSHDAAMATIMAGYRTYVWKGDPHRYDQAEKRLDALLFAETLSWDAMADHICGIVDASADVAFLDERQKMARDVAGLGPA